MEKYEIERLRSLNIEEVAERLGLEVQRHKCLCCFHSERNPSMVFNLRKNTYCCYSCGAHGDVLDLTMHILGKGFLDACQWLANENNVILSVPKPSPSRETERGRVFDASRYARFFEHPWLSAEACHFLFDVRHLDPRVVRWCRLNSYQDKQGVHWLQIPYYDQDGRLVGVQSRNLSPRNQGDQGGQPRFRFPMGSKCHLYNLQVIPMLQPDEPIWIAEGPSDTWSMLSTGHKAVGIPSATLLKPQDLLPLAGRECHVTPDVDAAGESLYQKLLSAANDIGFCLIRYTLPEGCKDFSDYYCKCNALPAVTLGCASAIPKQALHCSQLAQALPVIHYLHKKNIYTFVSTSIYLYFTRINFKRRRWE